MSGLGFKCAVMPSCHADSTCIVQKPNGKMQARCAEHTAECRIVTDDEAHVYVTRRRQYEALRALGRERSERRLR